MSFLAHPRLALAALLLSLSTSVAGAHEFWLEPSSTAPAVGEWLELGLRVGHPFRGKAFARDPAHVLRFVLAGPGGGLRHLGAEAGETRDARILIEAPGLHVVGYESTASSLRLPAARFERHAKHEGLLQVIESRRVLGESGKDGRELFRRCSKSIVAAGGATGGSAPLSLGLTLELTPDGPWPPLDRQAVTFTLLFEGEPQPDCLVKAWRSAEAPSAQARTDGEGRVTLPLTEDGPWLLTTVHAERRGAPVADWSSWWGALYFGLEAADIHVE